MEKVLIIGLDELGKEIINKIKKTNNYVILGYDFNPDKFELFRKGGFIENNENILINELLKQADVIIFNLIHDKYSVLFEFLPFINRSALIINTNSVKVNLLFFESILNNNKIEDFIPCNFFFFPKVIINNDTNSRLDIIKKASDFLKNINCPTLSMTPRENDFIFSNVYQMSFIMQKLLLGKNNIGKLFTHSDYDFLYNDVLINKLDINNKIDRIVDKISDLKNADDISRLIEHYELKKLDRPKIKMNENINSEIFNRVLIEKLFLSTFMNRLLEEYVDFNILNFHYIKYDKDALKDYCKDNITDIGMSIILIKEKMKSFVSILNMDNMDFSRLKRYLNG